MDFKLHTAHDHMDNIQNAANNWIEDDLQHNDDIHMTCASQPSLRAQCKVLCNCLEDILLHYLIDNDKNVNTR